MKAKRLAALAVVIVMIVALAQLPFASAVE